jgi:hypothetical protein
MIRRAKGRRESVLEARCAKWARAKKLVVAKMTGCAGIPDKVFFVPGGRPFLPEFKRLNVRPADEGLQTWYAKRLRQLGYDTAVVDTWEYFLKCMAKYGVR